MSATPALVDLARGIVGGEAVETLGDDVIGVDWNRARGSIYQSQREICARLEPGAEAWLFDLEDPPEDDDGVEVVGRGQGQLVQVSNAALTPAFFRKLARQQWLGLAAGQRSGAPLAWRVTTLFANPRQLPALVDGAGFSVGVVSYFDSASWLIFSSTKRLAERTDALVP